MTAVTDEHAYINDQALKAKRLYTAIVFCALDDAIMGTPDEDFGAIERAKTRGKAMKRVKQYKPRDGKRIADWARSPDGRFILGGAGFDVNERVIAALVEFVERGVRVSSALTHKRSMR